MSVFLLMSVFSISFGGEGDKIRVISPDTVKAEIGFEIRAEEDQTLHINLTGITDEFASISLVDQRGSALIYQFVKEQNASFDFQLRNINPGIYYVKLNLGSEIRLKMVVIE